jgi:RalA-binding protein 1
LAQSESPHVPIVLEKPTDADLREAAFLDMEDEEEDGVNAEQEIIVPVATSSPDNMSLADPPVVADSASVHRRPSTEHPHAHAHAQAPSAVEEPHPPPPPRARTRPSSDNLEALARSAPATTPSESQISVSTLSPEQQRFEYKAAKLTTDELPYTKVHVEGSTIRPNDRGKEVLSFIILVQTVNTEWRVEKLYSDVLTLDARVRAVVGKSQVKKIGTLPDSKLFKDNAPAKVDLRKVSFGCRVHSPVGVLNSSFPATDGLGDLFPDSDRGIVQEEG